jgi:hypothetical protein
MRPAALPHTPNELSATIARLSYPVKTLVAVAVALTFGFVIGSAAVGPFLSDDSPDNAAALKARFERRTVDPERHYPEPHPYRAQSPDFGPHRGPALGAYARQQAKRELPGRSRPTSSDEARAAFSSARPHETSASARETTGSRPASEPYRVPDRHTGALH